jgi:uncharacterized membrane protein YfcA
VYILFQSILPVVTSSIRTLSLIEGRQLSSTLYLAVFGIVAAAGLIRGTTGFGGSMFMAPPLSLLIGPAPTVVIALALETAAAITILPAAWGKVSGRSLAF